jgi:L-malate glycosyltransferase
VRILLGIQRLWRGGGTETHVITLANELKKLGHQVVIYTSGGEWVQQVRNLGIQVQTDPGMKRTSTRAQSSAIVKRYLLKQRFHVIHVHDAASFQCFSEAITGMVRRPKLVFTVHGPYVARAALLLAQDKADAVIAVSSEIRRSLPLFVNRRKVSIVPNGIQTNVFQPTSGQAFRIRRGIPQTAFVVGYCSRFTFDKLTLGMRIVRGLIQYAENHPNVHVVVAGRGSKQRIPSSRRVHIVGHVEHMPSFLSACDVMMGTARTAVEGLLCGVPVVTIGKAGYHGLVSSHNLSQMISTNFGDHGKQHTWTSQRLHADLRRVQRQRAKYHEQTQAVRKIIANRLSAGQMAKRVQDIYRYSS